MRRLLQLLDARDALFLVGGSLVVYGLALVSIPAAFIVPGVLLIALAVWRIR